MGAWGSGSFENDTALDWAAGVRSVEDVRGPLERLKALAGEGAYIDADLASEAVAAAETVAMLMGRTVPGFPEELRAQLAGAGEPDDRLYHAAREALFGVLRNSELAELWAETAAEAGTNAWHAAITALVDRLNPELETEPWTDAELAQQADGAVGNCAFCDGPVDRRKLFAMTLKDCSDASAGARTLWIHLACLNARLHHSHFVIDMKFDPDRLPDLDSL